MGAQPGFPLSPQHEGPSPWDVLGTLPLYGHGTGPGSLETLVPVSPPRSGFCVCTMKAGGAGPELPRCQSKARRASLVPAKQRAPRSVRAPCSLFCACLS